MKFIKALFCLLFLLSCQHKTPTEPDGETGEPQWALSGKNLRNTSNASDPVEYYSGPEKGEIVWTLNFGFDETAFTSPSIGIDGTIYLATSGATGNDSGFVYAVNPDGSVKWRFVTEKGYGPQATGALAQDGTYYIGSIEKIFYAIDKDGKVKWQREFPFIFLRKPSIAKNGDVILAINSGIIALDANTGETLWFYETSSIASTDIAIDKNGVSYTGTRGRLLSLLSNGAFNWEFPIINGAIIREPLITHDGSVVFTSFDDSLLYVLNPDGALKWTFNLMSASARIPAIAADGSIFAMTLGHFFMLAPGGEMLWQLDVQERFGNGIFLRNTTPIIDRDGTIYLTIGRTNTGENLHAVGSQGEKNGASLSIMHPQLYLQNQRLRRMASCMWQAISL